MAQPQPQPPETSTRTVDDFFLRCGLPPSTRLDCHAFLEHHIRGKLIELAPTQGYCSYTLLLDGHIIQFRPPNYSLDLTIASAAKDVFGSHTPTTTYIGTLQPCGLLVYQMEMIQGISYKDWSMLDHPQASAARVTLCEDFATFLALSWHNRHQIQLQPGMIGSSIRCRLEQLNKELPPRFQPIARKILSQMSLIDTLPVVLTHGDVVPSNIMLDQTTGHLCGLVDWAEAEILPFGICLYGLEEILGYMANGVFLYHTDSEQARASFWARLQRDVPELLEESTLKAVMLARDLGILLWYGFAFDDGAINRVVQEGRDIQEICYLDALLSHHSNAPD